MAPVLYKPSTIKVTLEINYDDFDNNYERLRDEPEEQIEDIDRFLAYFHNKYITPEDLQEYLQYLKHTRPFYSEEYYNYLLDRVDLTKMPTIAILDTYLSLADLFYEDNMIYFNINENAEILAKLLDTSDLIRDAIIFNL